MPAVQKSRNQAPVFTEHPAWRQFGAGWRPLHGNVLESGVSFEWHDFKTHEPFDWGQSFHPHSIEICLNIEGDATINSDGSEKAFAPMTVGGLQCVSFEPDVFKGYRHDHSAISPPVADGARRGITAVWKIQCHRNGAGGGIQQPEPFQPRFP